MSDHARTLADWIAIDSTSGAEGAYGDAIARHLAGLGLDVELFEVAPGRFNVLARAGRPRVLFCTHLDTVPPFVPPRVERTVVHGRGACDAKGQALAMAAAIERLVAEGRREVGVLLTVGEEVDGIGARAARDALAAGRLCDGRAPAFTVLGEPTDNRFVRAHKGIVKARLVARGTLSHSSRPLGPSAVHRLVGCCTRLLATDWGTDAVLGAGSINVGTLSGGRAANVVADEARATVMVRAVDDVERVHARLRAALEDGVELDADEGYGPARFHVPDGEEGTIVGFGTDAPYLAAFGERLLTGPGRIEDAHTATEKLVLADLEAGIARHVALGRTLLERPAARTS